MALKEKDLFNEVKGIILGKPIDEVYYEEYKTIYKEFFSKLNIPTLYNVNFGHAVPRSIIPYGLNTRLDLDNKKIMILESFFEK
jgi:muramoyltetrapeptide carboxypeptidase LdcA involved in peptidoglycan recycling